MYHATQSNLEQVTQIHEAYTHGARGAAVKMLLMEVLLFQIVSLVQHLLLVSHSEYVLHLSVVEYLNHTCLAFNLCYIIYWLICVCGY